VNWFRRDVFGTLAGEWLALAIVVLLTFAFRVAAPKLFWRLRSRKRASDESEKEYWRIHG